MIRMSLWADTLGAPVQTGTKTFLYETFSRLLTAYLPDMQLTLWFSKSASRDTMYNLKSMFPYANANVVEVPLTRGQVYLSGLFGRFINISDHIGRHDLYLSGSHWPLGRADTPSIGVFHDLAPLVFPPTDEWLKGRISRLMFRRAVSVTIHTASSIVSISRYTAHDLAHQFGIDECSIPVIHHGCNETLWGAPSTDSAWQAVANKVGLMSPYVMSLGQHVPRKNYPTLIRAFHTFLTAKGIDSQLILVGGFNTETQHLRNMIEALGLQRRVILTGPLSQDETICLMQKAFAFVFPSLYEGFGLPILEAMAAGVPVICSNTTSLPEIAGNAALFFDPRNEHEIAQSLGQVWENEHRRPTLIKLGRQQIKQFSWEQTAQCYANLIRKVANQ